MNRYFTFPLVFAFTFAPTGWANEPSVDFARQILPILSDKCFVCHGPDGSQETDLRLDSAEAASADLGGYRAIDSENLAASELLARIHSDDDPMPPVDAEKQLTDAERTLLERWVAAGGRYAKHWAFVPPRQATPPESDEANPIDRFIAAQLEQQRVSFSPPADPRVLARRAALVLTGLPPEATQLDQFLDSPNHEAYEQLVDQLLDSPRFGEHQAKFWLDAVRYGDTHGLHLDNRRGIYPYRDWVVRAYNENLPLDQFVTWQLAGDLLPQPTLEQRVATGFVRLNPSTSEGGAIPAEFQCKNNFDRTENLGTVLLGMTLTCARCHTHKYDPIPQREYYQLLAFFNSTAEPAMDGNAYRYGPIATAPQDQAGWTAWSEIERDLQTLLKEAETHDLGKLAERAEAHSSWEVSDWKSSKPVPATESLPPEGSFSSSADPRQPGRVKLPGDNKALWISCSVKTSCDTTVWATFDGSWNPAIQVDRQPIAPHPLRTDASNVVPVRLTEGAHTLFFKITGQPDRWTKFRLKLTSPWRTLADAGSWADCSNRAKLLILAEQYNQLPGPLRQRAVGLAHRMLSTESAFTTTLVAQELAEPRPTKVLERGEYNRPIGDPLQPDVLSVMGSLPAGAPRNRLGLAQWLTSRDHPLVSRVLVNRIWQRVFGAGLVRTPEDFGRQGQQPTHPELLDWLAIELQDTGWDLKRMLRLLVTSRTFQQSSAWRSEVDDPENRLWARGPGYRLDAEVLRDVGLWASQLLDPHMGGEGVKPFQPPGLWQALAHPTSNTKLYEADQGRKNYRRSLYLYWKRTSPHPMMTMFDAPDRESSCVRRSRTTTSQQSLALLNETQRIEIARALAERLLQSRATDHDRLDLLFQLLACRSPNEQERAACHHLLSTMQQRYAAHPEDAKALLQYGETNGELDLPPRQHASWTQVTATVLASDVAILLY